MKCPQEYKAQQTSASAVQLQKPPHLKVAQGRAGGFAAGVAADHAAALLPAALALDLVGGAPFWAIRRAMPTRPLCPLKNSQSANPAALAITFTLRAICDSDRMSESAFMAAGVMATTAPAASTSVLERTTVVKGAATRATSKRARSAAGSAVSKPRPRRRGWTAVSRMTARTSAVGAPVCRWGFANRLPQH